MSEMHLKQPGFTYSTCGPFTKNMERIPKFKETGDTLGLKHITGLMALWYKIYCPRIYFALTQPKGT